jgi:hypothetical protein
MSCGPTHVPRAGLLVTGHCVWNSRRRLPHWALRHTSVLPAFAVISWRSCRALKSLYFRRILRVWGPAYWMLWHWANPSWLHGLVVSRKPCRRASQASWCRLVILGRWQMLCAIASEQRLGSDAYGHGPPGVSGGHFWTHRARVWVLPFQSLRPGDKRQLPCRPCSTKGSTRCPRGHHPCMQQVTVAQVCAAARTMWGGHIA